MIAGVEHQRNNAVAVKYLSVVFLEASFPPALSARQ